MSRETLLDEAIAKAKECGDWQLAEWLRMARGGESAARWYSDKLRDAHRIERKLMDENAKLRELLARMARVLRADDEWSDPFYCNPYCADQFHCRSDDCVEAQCPIVAALRELGVDE